MRPRGGRTTLLFLSLILFAACGPGTALSLRVMEPSGLQGAQRVHVAEAVGRLRVQGHDERTDLRSELESLITRRRSLTVAASPEAADLVVRYYQADALLCPRCPEARELWYWWAFVQDAAGRKLAEMHGEASKAEGPPLDRFVRELRRLVRNRRAA